MGHHRHIAGVKKFDVGGRWHARGWLRGVALSLALVSSATLAQDASQSGTGGVTGDQIKQVLGLNGQDANARHRTALSSLASCWRSPARAPTTAASKATAPSSASLRSRPPADRTSSSIFKDHKSADAQAGARAARELGIAGVSAVLTSYVGDIGAMFPGLAQYKMLALDGGGGTSDFGQGKPYFWGMRAIEPDDDFIGALKYWKATDPKIKRISLVYFDQGPANEIVINNFNKALKETGLEFASREVTTIGATDYSATISRLKTANPDAVFLFSIGVDPGYFMKQFVNAGLTAPVIGAECIPDAAKVAGSAYDNYLFATDWFDASKPTNPWSKLFLKSYVKEFNAEPEIYAANYYEDTFAVWDLIRRVLAKGGNVNSGEEAAKRLDRRSRVQERLWRQRHRGRDDRA